MLSVVVDGEDAVRKAAREELRRGATQLKIMVSGGVLSPTDPVWMPQFTDAEIRAAVEEAASRRTYVMAHAHTADAARRCVAAGVRSIEHASLIDESTAMLAAASQSYIVPTLVIVERALAMGKAAGLTADAAEKMADIQDRALRSFEYCVKAGVKIGFGTDLLGPLHAFQNREFVIRREISTAFDILHSATAVNAALMNQAGQLGVVAPGAHADLIVVDGNPLEDISLLERCDTSMPLIMKSAVIYKDTLH